MIGHIIVFFAANFTGFLVNADRRNPIAAILLLAVPIAGVYFVGWWALLTSLVGLVFGGYIFWNTSASNHRRQPSERNDS